MKCEKYIDIIDDLVEGELDEEIAGKVNLHIFACPECASRYEILEQEKRMYAHYLFDIEPANDLPVKFRTKIKSEANNTSRTAWISVNLFGWKAGTAGFLRLHPASAVIVLLILFGIGYGLLKFMLGEVIRTEREYIAKTESGSVQFPTAKPAEIDKDATTDLPAEVKSDDFNDFSKGIEKTGGNRFPNAKVTAGTDVKFIAIKPAKIKKQKNSVNEKENSAANAQLTKEEQIQRLLLRNLEKQTAGQMEKIELLLRSFRNARFVEGSETFEVSYEKQQAKKLLKKNIRLRLIAENYGNLYAQEILSQVEPYLLDISNLEIYPSPAKVLDIQERLKNQNLIASLQAYY
jgi:hypothetical protein